MENTNNIPVRCVAGASRKEEQLSKVTVTLDEEQLMELERIVLDEDEPEALRFLEEVDRKVKKASGNLS